MAEEPTEVQRRGFLKDEYLFLQAQYEDYDRRSLTIKSWVSTAAVTALALAFNSSYHQGSIAIAIMVAIAVGVVWYLEAYWKLFQYALSDRIRIIEAYFRDEREILVKGPPDPFQIYHWWYRSYAYDKPIFEYEKKTRPRSHAHRLRRAAFQRFVMLPHLPLLIFCAVTIGLLARDPTGQHQVSSRPAEPSVTKSVAD
jgi:hypothetical protein